MILHSHAALTRNQEHSFNGVIAKLFPSHLESALRVLGNFLFFRAENIRRDLYYPVVVAVAHTELHGYKLRLRSCR